jgi:hypothetical protein
MKGKLKLTLEFEDADAFQKFCAVLLAGGMEDVVRQLAAELLAEGKRRGLPYANELELAIAHEKATSDAH